ncbi:Anaphase-promoting complex subunit 4 [Citrus sinensis]|uniref:Anaphase-promoting complex subunit 4 n=1 Tax=Citrus sinensis TaxID=2711 RepID=A0ACB8NFV7_CITSI|nr:Anaphase-promoting complex subunit 4 [Citrus sinensis]
METDEAMRVLPFQLQFDKPVASQIKIAEWNPEKDLLAMATEDSKILLHRFNWQRLWTISPGKSVTSLCWRPDGKAIAVGLEDGTITLHDVENGKLLRSLKSHTVAVVCLNWEEDAQPSKNDFGNIPTYEDRTSRFFPPAPRIPQMPGLVSGDTGFTDDSEDSFRELANSSHQRFSILCSGDKDGSICFNIFGIFPIGKINIHKFHVAIPNVDEQGRFVKGPFSFDSPVFRTTQSRGVGRTWKDELYQVALQASNIEDLTEVIRESLTVMCLDSSPQEEFLSLLGGARTSPPIHQFLANSLGEAGVKRVSKAVCGAGKELQLIVLNHLQPAAEIIGFRMGELRGLSRWRARFHGIGLDEKLINNATENSGMFLVQVERFMRVLSSVVQQFSNFFNWLLKCIKLLMQEPSDQLPRYNSELVVIFLKFLYDQDPVRQLLEPSEIDHDVDVDLETMQRVRDLVNFGGFSDCNYLRRTLLKEFQLLESSFKEAFLMPFTTISTKILCEDFLPLFPLPSSPTSVFIPMSVSYYKGISQPHQASDHDFIDYVSFQVPNEPFSDIANCIGILRGFMHDMSGIKKGYTSLEAVLLSVPSGYHCVDLSLYKEGQIVLLLNEACTSSDSGEACMMIVRTSDLPFVSVSRSPYLDHWELHQLKDSVFYLQMGNAKVRIIPHSVVAPLAVSASRGVASVYATRKRALVYILEEDEDEVSDTE